MAFQPTALPGCTLIEMTPHGDARGFFSRLFCAETFAAQGLASRLAQTSYSVTTRRGALRGLHFQAAPRMEAKLVTCLRGAIFDVMVDIRPGSPTFGKWLGHELSETNGLQLHAAAGFAHGFQTLTENCLVAYHIFEAYEPSLTAGLRWDDPAIAVAWPATPVDLSPRDAAAPFLADLDRALLTPFDADTCASGCR